MEAGTSLTCRFYFVIVKLLFLSLGFRCIVFSFQLRGQHFTNQLYCSILIRQKETQFEVDNLLLGGVFERVFVMSLSGDRGVELIFFAGVV